MSPHGSQACERLFQVTWVLDIWGGRQPSWGSTVMQGRDSEDLVGILHQLTLSRSRCRCISILLWRINIQPCHELLQMYVVCSVLEWSLAYSCKKWTLLNWILAIQRNLEENLEFLLRIPDGGHSLSVTLSVECRTRQNLSHARQAHWHWSHIPVWLYDFNFAFCLFC